MTVSAEAIGTRVKLMSIVADEIAAFNIAQAFVMDDEVKLEMFVRHWGKCNQYPAMDQRATAAVSVASERWAVINIAAS